MDFVKKLALGIVGIVIVLGAVGLVLPSAYKVERSTVINAPAEKIFAYINDLKMAEQWSPWKQKDASIQNTYSEQSFGVGAKVSWTSKKSGDGTQTLTESTPYTTIKSDIDFGKMGISHCTWTLAPEGNGTKVTWTMSGDQGRKIIARYFNLFMDKMVGPDFEKGLQNLKGLLETNPVA